MQLSHAPADTSRTFLIRKFLSLGGNVHSLRNFEIGTRVIVLLARESNK
jgi:hypothetical protein